MAINFRGLSDKIGKMIEQEIQGLPRGFFDSFRYTKTGNNLTHPVMLGTIPRVLCNFTEVNFVGVDVRLNLGDGTKFQPDVVAYDKNFKHLVFLDYESPNSSDARILDKNVDQYLSWIKESRTNVPYLIITTLPNREVQGWELRYTSKGYPNFPFRNRKEELVKNPFQFWYSYYRSEFSRRDITNIALLNIDGKQVTTVIP
jgi:hypothetical protein